MPPPEPAGPLAPARRPPGGQDHRHHEAQRPAGSALAGRQGQLRPPGQRHRPGLPGALAQPSGRPAAGRGPPGRLPGSPRLERPAHPSAAADPAAHRPGRGRPARSRDPGPTPIPIQARLLPSLAGSIAELDRALAPPPRPSTQGHGPPATAPASARSTRPRLLAEVGPILDRTLRPPQAAAESAPPGHQAVRQGHRGPVPLGSQHPRPRAPWAPWPTTAATPPGEQPPVPASRRRGKRHPRPSHPDARLARGQLGLLAYRPALRHQPPPRSTTAGQEPAAKG
jgi:hypothetical protein